jgi:hypothetical protein
MVRKRAPVLCILLALAAGGRIAYAYDDGDWQFWNTDTVEYKFTDKLKAKIEVADRFGDDMNEFFYFYVQPGVAYKLTSWFEAGAAYELLEEKKSGDWFVENRLIIDGTFSTKLMSIAVSDRNRFEYRDREATTDLWRYRNRLRAVLPFQWTALKIQPYADEEVFVDLNTHELNQNRSSAGLIMQVTKNLKTETYYMVRSDRKSGEWQQTNVIGLNFRLAF